MRVSIGSTLSVGFHGSAVTLGFLASLLFARTMGPDEFGAYGFALSVVSFFAIPVHYGLATLTLKEVASTAQRGNWGRLKGFGLGIAAVYLVACVAAAGLILFFSAVTRYGKYYDGVLVTAVPLVPALSLTALLSAWVRGLGYPLLGQSLDLLLRHSMTVVILLWIWAAHVDMDASGAVGITLVATMFAILPGILVLVKTMPAGVRQADPQYDWRSWIPSLAPLTSLGMLQAGSVVVATTALATVATAADIAYYRVAALGSLLITVPLTAVGIQLAADIAQYHETKSYSALQRASRHGARVALAFAFPVALALVFFGRPVLNLFFGPEYVQAATALAILSIAEIAKVCVGIVAMTMNMSGRYFETARAVAIGLLVQLVLTVVLAPRLGAEGAAIGVAAGTLTWAQVLHWRIKKLFGISTTVL